MLLCFWWGGADGCRWRMDEVLPGKVESRVALVREMMMLF